jgi:hypothetical protein
VGSVPPTRRVPLHHPIPALGYPPFPDTLQA